MRESWRRNFSSFFFFCFWIIFKFKISRDEPVSRNSMSNFRDELNFWRCSLAAMELSPLVDSQGFDIYRRWMLLSRDRGDCQPTFDSHLCRLSSIFYRNCVTRVDMWERKQRDVRLRENWSKHIFFLLSVISRSSLRVNLNITFHAMPYLSDSVCTYETGNLDFSNGESEAQTRVFFLKAKFKFK